jgi:hypothetical protein
MWSIDGMRRRMLGSMHCLVSEGGQGLMNVCICVCVFSSGLHQAMPLRW